MSESRKLKFKTLDNKITEIVVPTNISIPDLKAKVKDLMGIEVNLQRMIYKGKQLKDDMLLSDYGRKLIINLVSQDEEVVHLMARMVEQATSGDNLGSGNQPSTSSQPNTSNNPFGNTSNTSNFGNASNTANNPFGNILGGILNNPNTMVQMTSMLFGDEGGSSGNNNLNNLLRGMTNPQGGQQLNINNLLQGLLNPNTGNTNTPNANTTQNNLNDPQSIISVSQPTVPQSNSQSGSRYPILDLPNQHIENINKLINEINPSQSNSSPVLPQLNYPINVLTEVGGTLNSLKAKTSSFLAYVELLSQLLQRESLVVPSEERQKVRDLISQVRRGLDDLSKSSGALGSILGGLEYGNAPGCGFYRIGEAVIDIGVVGVENLGNVQNNVNNDSSNTNMSNTNMSNTTQNIPTSNQNTLNTPSNTQNSTRPATTPSDPFSQILSQMSQPGNMQMMMNMVGGLLGNQAGGTSGNTTSSGANPLNNLLSQLMNPNAPQINQSSMEYFSNILNNPNLKKTTRVGEIPEEHLKINPEPDFVGILPIINSMTISEVVDLKALTLSAFTRLRKNIKTSLFSSLVNSYGNNKEKLLEGISDMIMERITLCENETDKIIREDFTVETHLCPFIRKVVDLFLNEELSDIKFESLFKKEVSVFFAALYNDLKSVYNTGSEGACEYFDYNFESLVRAVIGNEAYEVIYNLDKDLISELVDNLVHSFCSGNEANTDVEMTSEDNDVNMTVEQILNIANTDKNRINENEQIEFIFQMEARKSNMHRNNNSNVLNAHTKSDQGRNLLNRKTMRKMKRMEKRTKKDFFYKNKSNKEMIEDYKSKQSEKKSVKSYPSRANEGLGGLNSKSTKFTKFTKSTKFNPEDELDSDASLQDEDEENGVQDEEEIDSDQASELDSEEEANKKPSKIFKQDKSSQSNDGELDTEIKKLEKRLGLKDGKKFDKFKKKVAMENYDEDLFDFLDNIGSIVKQTQNHEEDEHTNIPRKQTLNKQTLNKQDKQEKGLHKTEKPSGKLSLSQLESMLENKPKITDTSSQPTSRLFSSMKLSDSDKLKLSFQKDITSLLNKISEANLTLMYPEFIQKIENVEKCKDIKDRVNLIYETITKVSLKMTLDSPVTNLPITSCICSYLSVLHSKFGNTFLLYFLKSLFDRINPIFLECSSNQENLSSESHRAVLKNFIFLIIPFYIFQNLTSKTYFDLIKQLILNFNPLLSEILLILLSYLGIEIRKEDPESLKDIISEVNRKYSTIKLENNQTKTGKLKYIVDMIDDIKNNKFMKFNLAEKFNFFKTFVNANKKAYTDANYDLTSSKIADKVDIAWTNIKNLDVNNLNMDSVSELKSNDTFDTNLLDSVDQEKSQQLNEKMRKFKMTTDLKKMIFTAIASSTDCNDAFERLTRLSLKRDQQREIIKIIILLAREEKSYNPFYKLLLSKLISVDKDHKYTFHYSIWDQMKAMENEQFGGKKIHNLGKLVGSLLIEEKISLPVFLNYKFEDADENTKNLIVTCFDFYFEKVGNPDKCKLLFAKLVKNDDHVEFAKRLFHFLIKEFKKIMKLDDLSSDIQTQSQTDINSDASSKKSTAYLSCFIAATKVLKRIL